MVFNAIGFFLFAAAFASGLAIARSIGSTSEGVGMMISGPLLAALDLAVRILRDEPYVRGERAGTILFLPAWLWGVFWTGLGAVYYARGG